MQTRTRAGILFTSTLGCLTLALATRPTGLDARPARPAAVDAPAVDDGRVATVVDRQGLALVRPVGRERWTPLRQRALLMPGDLVRTSLRGANALEVQLVDGGTMILGPGSLVELSRGKLRLYRGALSVDSLATKSGSADRKAPVVEVTGPGGFKQTVAKSLVVRVQAGRTVVLAKAPRWLAGYRASTSDDWVGSLVAKIDGRDVPLSVGYHKADVVIRDQIAQTTVEQSFVNSTKTRLEGVFYFPLPADASIGGFGMWIGNELVEADIVEKQRARQIYEDILRRKKDPGLLEWNGGNLFKARVFPIEPHSEKRIRIRYTQVLPMEGSTVRYRYALRSELLRNRPLRELGIKVSVSSSTKIESVASSTHEVRVRKTDHAATLEFDAEEFTPEKDFEAAITLERAASVTMVPHRRVNDGYFMMLLSPPGENAGKWQRDLMPEGQPVDLIVVADTSASMDAAARAGQADFILGLLRTLGAKDHFRLMTADIDVHHFVADPAAVSDASIESALKFLALRDSMGWTDLDRVLMEISRAANPNSVVVYVGDGIGTTGDADPVALAKRIRQLGADCKGVVHAVAVASTYEQGVLEALASVGGGSVRSVGDDPAQSAFDLLSEAAQPAIKDVKIRFEGLSTARVYPETPPNLPLGTQQIVLGRFLPTGQDQSGRAIVTGTLAGQPVRYSSPVEIRVAETGNSFIPRLWARRHLDALLAEGRTPQVQEDIVGFSQEFGIMTRYTSFLVLENDADRKRYGVERRVAMRDGEKFFAKGRDAASTEVLRQQMRQARTYRLQLRLRMMQEIGSLGRSLHGWSVAHSGSTLRGSLESKTRYGIVGGGARGRAANGTTPTAASRDLSSLGPMSPGAVAAERLLDKGEDQMIAADADEMDLPEMEQAGEPLESAEKRVAKKSEVARFRAGRRGLPRSKGRFEQQQQRYPNYDFSFLGFPYLPPPQKAPKEPRRAEWSKDVIELLASLDRRDRLMRAGVAFALRAETRQLHAIQSRIVSWSAVSGYFDGSSSGGWLLRQTGRNAQPTLQWVNGGKRGVLAESLRLGRQRASNARDRRFQFPLADYSTRDFAAVYVDYSAELVPLDGAKVRVVLTARKPRQRRMEFVVDRERRVVEQLETFMGPKRTSTTTFANFVEKGGEFFAQKVEHKDANDRLAWRRNVSVETMPAKECGARIQASLRRAETAVLIGQKEPTITAAKQALHVGKAGLPERLRMVTHYAATQQWDRVWGAWAKVVEVTGTGAMRDELAADLIRLKLQSVSRKGEEFRAKATDLVASFTGLVRGRSTTPAGVDFLTGHVRQLAMGVLSPREQLTMLQACEPIYRRASGGAGEVAKADQRDRDLSYRRFHAGLLESVGRSDEALREKEQTAKLYGNEFQAIMDFAYALANAKDSRRQSSVLAAAVAKKNLWLDHEVSSLFDNWLIALFALRDLAELNRVAAEWVTRDPKNASAYGRHLASLMFRNRATEADKWLGERLAESPGDEVQIAKLRAAAQFALGQGWQMSNGTVRDRWHAPLAGLVRRCAKSDDAKSLQLAREIVGNWNFRRTDAFGSLRKEFLVDLLGDEGASTMSLDRLAIYMSWIEWGRNSIDREDWAKARDLLKARFAKAEDVGTQQVLGGHVLHVLDSWPEKTAALGFLRGWLAVAKANPESVAQNLLQRLLAMDWNKAYEDESFALIARLQPEKAEPPARDQIATNAIRQLADELLAARIKASLGPVAELEKLPRAERREREQRTTKNMREKLATRMGVAAAAAAPLETRWFRIEQFCLAAEAGGDRARSVEQAAELLADIPWQAPEAASERAESSVDVEPFLERVLRERCALVMAYAATRRGAAASVGDAALAHYRQQLASREKSLDWRYQIFRLLIALDRTDDLSAELRKWIVPAKADTTWRRSLGYLLAEHGKIREAVEVFEGVRSADELTPADYSALANWYLVLGDDGRRERALLRHYEVSSEGALSSVLYQARNRANQRGSGLGGTIRTEDLMAIRALLTKAARPENYTWQLQAVYDGTKDFRVLGALPYGVVGHSAGSVYRYLGRVGQVVNRVHEEATCDSLAESIRAMTATVDRVVDRRGLLLITALTERRAAEVKNAPSGHVDVAIAAMRRAFKGEWGPGEREQMAGYLASLGRIRHPGLEAEQLRQLRELFAAADRESGARLRIAHHYAKTLWAYERREPAIDTLTMALQEYRALHTGVLPRGANTVVASLMSYYRSRRHFARGERYLLDERGRQALQSQKNWYTQQLFGLYIDCVGKRGEVSLGRGEKLYLAVRAALLQSAWEDPADVMRTAFRSFLSLHSTAAKAGIERAKADIVAFAKTVLPELAPRFVLDQGSQINRVANTVKTIVGPTAAVETLIAALEREPAWLRTVNREFWRNFTWNLARYRREAANRSLDARLLPIALRELRTDLGRVNWRNTAMFYRNNRYFWVGASSDFAKTANEFIKANSDSVAKVMFAANYLWSGLSRKESAIVALEGLHTRGKLAESGEWQLARWYDETREYDSAVPILKALVAKRTDRLDYRTLLVTVLHKDGDDKAARDLMLATEKLWQAKERWNESSMASLAKAAFESRFFAAAAKWYEEAVRANERTGDRRGSRRGNWRSTRSGYYGFLARAHAELGNTDAAIDAASAAVVTWGNDQKNRKAAVTSLYRVISRVDDLDGYVQRWDAKVAETGLDAPLIRKQLGFVYLDNGAAKKSIQQLLLARELQPTDDEVHKRLVAAYDRIEDEAGAIDALKTSISMSPMNLDLYGILAQRLASAGDETAAERAYTSMVEVKPNEAESHRRLAKVRENQRRFKDAVIHWHQVVRVRTLEPTGWLSLAKAQIEAGELAGAEKSIKHVLDGEWETRFKGAKADARSLLQVLAAKRG